MTDRPTLVDCAFAVASLPSLVWTGYLAALALTSRAPRVPDYPPEPRTRFDVVVPAHDEEAGIAATVESLRAVDYPAGRFRVVVVADNCGDATAERAARAGATVLERKDETRRGKGYALAHAFERSLAAGDVDAVVVVDADTQVSDNLLRAFDARLAGGEVAVQAEYCVANPRASWRTRLMHIGFTLFHDVRSRARERFRLSAGLRGNGMAFARAVLREVPHDAFSIVEDVEYGIRLGLAGHRVAYAGEAKVFGEMVSSGSASRSQRRRWEGGRMQLLRAHARRLVSEAVARRDPLLFDLAADLLVPPLTYVALVTFAGTGASALRLWLASGAWWSFAPWCASLLGLSLYVARGVWLARVGPRAILDLAWAPVYMVWKVLLAMKPSRARDKEWVRTARQGDKP